MRRWARLFFVLLLLPTVAVGCAKDAANGPQEIVAPEPIEAASCAACGMVVAEQPAPRGQVVYRDGLHAHSCSIGDLVLVAQTPSPHGSVVAVYVEAQDDAVDPIAPATEPTPQHLAESLHYIRGAKRRGIMGAPVLAFRDQARAQREADKIGLQLMTWRELLRAEPTTQSR